jgi:GTP cyclohydrolase III
LELPLLEPPSSSKCNCVEWEALKEDFDADFRRLREADLNRMELPRVGDKAVAHSDLVGMTATNDVYISSYHSAKGSYQELLLQKEKVKKRASAGGSVAGGDAAASGSVFEYCGLLFKALREQWSCFKEQHKVLLLPGKNRAGTADDAESKADKAEEEKRKKLLPSEQFPRIGPSKSSRGNRAQ